MPILTPRYPSSPLTLPAPALVALLAGLSSAAFAISPPAVSLPLPRSYQTTVTVSAVPPLGSIDPAIYGQYLEHVEREDECIYPSLWDNTSPRADASGLRTDVLEAVRDLQVPVVRWPGGCFADVYHWEDGIGPRGKRPVRPNEHWGGLEPNQFGTDEFLQWCRLGGVTPYINVNLGSGTLDEALRWLQYCNGSSDTPQGARRLTNGHPEPWNVLHWGIGNETWGPWERGHTDADSYARRLAEWAEAMRRRDPRIRILAVGSEEGNDPAWDRTVLRHAGHLIDYLTLHTYGVSTEYRHGTEYEALAFTPAYMEDRMRKMLRTIDEFSTATANAAAATTTSPQPHSARPIRIAVDEWNIRHHRDGKFTRRDPRNLQDAVFVSGMLNAMIRLSPRVGMANYVFLVNGNGTLLADRDQVVRTPLFHVFRQYRQWMTGEALPLSVEGPRRYAPPPLTSFPGRQAPLDYAPGAAPYLDAAAARRPDGTLALALVNRHPRESAAVSLQLPAGHAITGAWVLAHDDPYAVNDFVSPERIAPHSPPVPPGTRHWTCPPRSVVLLLAAPAQ